ncbi:Antitoxin HicB [Phycisphaerae bacterium RAS2]|nr:Antitoxin HicB [Phycisphaerae bacterium RAS2]
MSHTFPVILIPQPDGGYFVDCPSLPGCHSQGDTRDEALENIREAIVLVLEDMAEKGEPVPVTANQPMLAEVQVTT